MPTLSYVDFIPRLIEQKSCFSTLSLSSGVPGPAYEGYDALVERANTWLTENPESRAVSCETLVVEGVYKMGSDDDSLTGDLPEERRFPAYLNMLRMWISSDGQESEGVVGRPRPCQLGYRDILPARLETNPDAFGPKYEGLTDALRTFNSRLTNGEETIPGKVVSMETCTCRFTTRNCSVDPNKTFWMAGRKSDVHCYSFFRLFFTVGTPAVCELGFQDFNPQYTGNPKKSSVKSENFVQLTRRAEQWCQNAKRVRLINVQTVDHNMYFRCFRDAIGHERKVLDNPHCVHTHGHSVYHTMLLRLYYVVRATGSAVPPSRPHLLHKTFHLPSAVCPASIAIGGATDNLLPHNHMQETMCKIRRWIALKGVTVTGVETVRLLTGPVRRDSVTAESTHFESPGTKAPSVVYAIRLYLEDKAGNLSKKDLYPEPRMVKLSETHCTIL